MKLLSEELVKPASSCKAWVDVPVVVQDSERRKTDASVLAGSLRSNDFGGAPGGVTQDATVNCGY